MISVVCVYNDEEILSNWLLKSLKSQTVTFELIKINNTEGTFKSAAEALNYGGKKIGGKYIMFVHQDVDLSSNSWLEDAEKIVDSISDLGIAGVAGMSEEGERRKDRGRNIIKCGDRIWSRSNSIQKSEPVQTLDECLVIIPKSVFDVLTFDEMTCNDWHLYAVDYCLSAREFGLEVYAIPMFIHHKSTLTFIKGKSQIKLLLNPLPAGYYQTLRKVLQKHKDHVKWIYTTTGDWRTSYPLILQRILQRIVPATKGLMYLVMIKLGFRYLWRKSGLKYLWKKVQLDFLARHRNGS